MLACGMFLTACGGNGGDTKAPQDKTEANAEANKSAETKDKDQFANTWWQEEPTTLNSAKGSDSSSVKILTNVMEPLTRLVENENGTLEVVPAAAESWEVSADGLTYTFKLRDNKWSDGKPVTAKDYEFGIQTACSNENAPVGMAFLIDCIKGVPEALAGKGSKETLGVKAIDDKTLEIVVNEPTPYFMQLTSTRPMLPIRQDKFEEMGERYGTEADTILTNGPFKLDSWVHQTELQLSKNPEYWDADNVSYEKVSWRIMEDENTRMNAFLNGEIDSVGSNKKEWQDQFANLPNVKHKEMITPQLDYFFFNTMKAPFDNPKVRLAFSLALDRQEAIDAVYNGVGKPATGWVVPGIQAGEKAEGDYRTLVPGPLEALAKEHADPKALLIEGLKESGMDPDPAKFNVTLEFGGTSEKMKEIGDYFLNTFAKKLGINMEVKLNEWSAFTAQVNEGNFNLGYMAWSADYNDPYAMMSLNLTNVNGLYTGWSNEDYDKLVKEAKASTDPKVMLEKYGEAEKILMEESPIIPILFPVSNTYRYDYVKGLAYNMFSTQGLKYGFTMGR